MKGKFREPWTDQGDGSAYDRTSDWVFTDAFPEVGSRIVACVNALDGRDPAKLATFIEACKALEEMRPSLSDITRIEPDGGTMTDWWTAYDALTRDTSG